MALMRRGLSSAEYERWKVFFGRRHQEQELQRLRAG